MKKLLLFLLAAPVALFGLLVFDSAVNAKPAAADCVGTGATYFNGVCAEGERIVSGGEVTPPQCTEEYFLTAWIDRDPMRPIDVKQLAGPGCSMDLYIVAPAGTYACVPNYAPFGPDCLGPLRVVVPPTYRWNMLRCVVVQEVWWRNFDQNGNQVGPDQYALRGTEKGEYSTDDCLPTWNMGSEPLACGRLEFAVQNRFNDGKMTGSWDTWYVQDSTERCSRLLEFYYPEIREELIPIDSSITIDAPEVIPVGGSLRPSTAVAAPSGEMCRYNRFEDGALTQTRTGPCESWWYLAAVYSQYSYSFTDAPEGGATRCATQSEIGCYYFSRTATQGDTQSITAYGFRATGPTQSVRFTLGDPRWTFYWRARTTPAYTNTCLYQERWPGYVPAFPFTDCSWIINGPPTSSDTFTPGSVTPRLVPPSVAIPIVGALPTPTDKRGGTGGN